MKLYGSYTSPFVRHCRIALAESGQHFEFIETDYNQSAQGSSAQRVPYLRIGDTQLHDSSSILKYIREHSGAEFLSDLITFNRYCLINTALDTCINLFLLERDGFTGEQIPYLKRQQARIDGILNELNTLDWPEELLWNDANIRLACFLDWALFRQRLHLDGYPELFKVLQQAREKDVFSSTAPPQ